MPVIEVEVGDDGAIGKLPEPLQKFFDKRFDEAVKKGAEKAETKLSPYLADPVELERLRQRDKLASEFELKEAERVKDYEKARKVMEETAAKDKDAAVKAEKANTAKAIERVRASVAKTIRAAALANGARAESLDELERLLAVEIDLDDNLDEYVMDPKDRKVKRVNDKGEAVTVEGLVADYLKTHPHHVAASPVQGGGARGGATLAGRTPISAASSARARIVAEMEANPSIKNIGRVLASAGAQE